MQLDALSIPVTPHVQVLGALPSGPAGVRATLKIMKRWRDQYKTNPTIRNLALQLTTGLPQKDHRGEIERVHAFVRDSIRYVRDVAGVETLQTPLKTLELRAGDCDDKSTLIATLLASIGYPTRFVAVGFAPGRFSHVFAEVRRGTAWIALETTEYWPVGKKPPGIASKMTQE